MSLSYDSNDFVMDPMNEIVPNLWLGNIVAAQNTEVLQKHNIHSVLSVIKGKLNIAEVRAMLWQLYSS